MVKVMLAILTRSIPYASRFGRKSPLEFRHAGAAHCAGKSRGRASVCRNRVGVARAGASGEGGGVLQLSGIGGAGRARVHFVRDRRAVQPVCVRSAGVEEVWGDEIDPWVREHADPADLPDRGRELCAGRDGDGGVEYGAGGAGGAGPSEDPNCVGAPSADDAPERDRSLAHPGNVNVTLGAEVDDLDAIWTG